MGDAIPTQHPAVVLRSHYTHLRIMLAIAMIAVIALSVAVVVLSGDDGSGTRTTQAVSHGDAAGSVLVPPASGQRYDGGPNEGTAGLVARATSTRYDGGPEEGSRGVGH